MKAGGRSLLAVLMIPVLAATAVTAEVQYVEDPETGIRVAKLCGPKRPPPGAPPPGPPPPGAPLNAPRPPPAAGIRDVGSPCWFHATEDIKSRSDCQAAFDQTQQCNKGPIFVPLGKYDVCVKFETAKTWFYTVGSNGHCSSEKCCQWYPPSQCNRLDQLIQYFELPAGTSSCDQVENPDELSRQKPEILEGEVEGEKRELCILSQVEESSSKFIQETVELKNCAAGCCLFTPVPAE